MSHQAPWGRSLMVCLLLSRVGGLFFVPTALGEIQNSQIQPNRRPMAGRPSSFAVLVLSPPWRGRTCSDPKGMSYRTSAQVEASKCEPGAGRRSQPRPLLRTRQGLGDVGLQQSAIRLNGNGRARKHAIVCWCKVAVFWPPSPWTPACTPTEVSVGFVAVSMAGGRRDGAHHLPIGIGHHMSIPVVVVVWHGTWAE